MISALPDNKVNVCRKMWQMLSMLYVRVRSIYIFGFSLSFSFVQVFFIYSRVRPTKSTLPETLRWAMI